MNIGQLREDASGILDVKLFEVAGTPISAATLVTISAIVIVALLVSKLLKRAVSAFFQSRGLKEAGTVLLVTRLVHYAMLVLGLGIALGTAGIDLGALFAAGAVFAVGIGFAMQNIVQNFVSGLILLAERTINPGDILEVEGDVVKVTELGIRATFVRTLNDEDLIVPNSLLVQSTVKNFTLRDSIYRIRATVGVVYASDMKRVMDVLTEAGGRMEWRVPSHEPRVLMTGFGDSSVNFEVSVWTGTPFRSKRQLSQLNEAIWWALGREGITIAFPQLDVHFDPPVAGGLERMGTAA